MPYDLHRTLSNDDLANRERRRRMSTAFWSGPLEPIEALLPAGTDPAALRIMPVSMRRAYVLAVRGEATPRMAIQGFCAECCGYDRRVVASCPATACPLWQFRPWQPEAPAA